MGRARNIGFGTGLAAKAWWLAAAMMGPGLGCSSDAGSDGPTTSASSGPSTGASGDASESTATSTSTGTSSGGDVADASSGSGGGSGSDSGSGSGGEMPPPAADGESCVSGEGCESGACFDAGILGGVCGACASSADCDAAGCHPPNPFIEPRLPSNCEPDDGDGAACESAADCSGTSVCATIMSLPGVFDVRGCGSCESAKDCARGERCSPTYDLPGLAGTRSCVAVTTLEDGAHCDPQNGADVCLNACRSVDFEGLATVGVCSMCGGNGDCEPKTEVCAPPELVDGELQPAACVPAKTPR